MSDALRDREAGAPRPLRRDERDLVIALLTQSPSEASRSSVLDSITVLDMSDGVMGSIKFLHRDDRERRFGFELAKATYIDDDGVLVTIALNLDQYGDLFEVDFWKVDFSPLVRYPRVDELTGDPSGTAAPVRYS